MICEERRTVTTIDPSRVIKKPTITIDPSVRYSFGPVRKVFSAPVAVSIRILVASSGVESPFSGSVRSDDGADLSMMKISSHTKLDKAE